LKIYFGLYKSKASTFQLLQYSMEVQEETREVQKAILT